MYAPLTEPPILTAQSVQSIPCPQKQNLRKGNRHCDASGYAQNHRTLRNMQCANTNTCYLIHVQCLVLAASGLNLNSCFQETMLFKLNSSNRLVSRSKTVLGKVYGEFEMPYQGMLSEVVVRSQIEKTSAKAS